MDRILKFGRALTGTLGVAAGLGGVAAVVAQPASRIELRPGDHIAIIGNALADRMQHSGYFETLLHARFPEHRLVVRNLAATGDEVVIRHRSENFGTPDDWLKRTQADVIVAFFGFNESFKGFHGVTQFKADLEKFVRETRQKDYSGKGVPRLVLVSPIATERHRDSNFPDPGANNLNLQAYTAAMGEVARAQGVGFVDLYAPSQEVFATAARQLQSLTINGLHLSPEGDKRLAPVLFQGLFGEPAPAGDFERLRAAVNAKNREWHQRYRTVDGYNVFGGRSALAFEPGKGPFITDRNAPPPHVSNFKVMQEEMAQRDALAAHRDQAVWAIARGGDAPTGEPVLPPVTRVRTNKPGPNADESHVYLGGEAAMAKMTVHSGMKVNLFASEEQFPELINPVQMAWDTKGRLWVAVWPNYPERTPDSKVGDSLLIFEDTNADGRADKVAHFLDDLNAPTGFQFYRDGVLVMQAPDFWFVRDTNGDDKADTMERVLMGMDSADSHHTANAICYDPGGALYLSDGVFHRTQVETAQGPVRNDDGAIYRFEPRTGRFETYVAYGFANPHGRVFDYWGNDIITDATGNANYFGPGFSGFLDYPMKHAGMKEFWNRPSRPCPATGILTSRHFPEEFQGNFLNLNVISFQGIYRVRVSEDGSGLKGETLENVISSTDPNFRPIAISTGPDGAIYFCDWHQTIIGHMQHHIRDPNRDHNHGRIYRITYNGRPLMTPVKIDGQPIAALLELLKLPENQTRELAKIELGKRDSGQVTAAAKAWISGQDRNDPNYAHHVLEALWVHQWHNVVDRELLERVLGSPEPRARAAAARVLCYWRDRVPDALDRFRRVAEDSHPRVRLEAVRAASFFRTADAAGMAVLALKQPTDYYLDYTLKESLRQLDKWWRPALIGGQALAADNPSGRSYLLARLTTAELLKLPRNAGVLEDLVTRLGVTDSDRNLALRDLAELNHRKPLEQLLALIEAHGTEATATGLARLLPVQSPDDLKTARTRVAALTSMPRTDTVRAAAWAALAVADDSFDGVWPAAARDAARLADLLDGIPLLLDPDFRSRASGRVLGLLTPSAAELQRALAATPGGDPVAADTAAAVRRAAIVAGGSMTRDQEALFGALAGLIAQRDQVIGAARGLRTLPRATWPREPAGAAAAELVAWAKTVPAGERTSQDYVETVQFAADLAGFLPASKAAQVREDLRALRVARFVIRSVREQMRYDTARLVVEAGKPFEITFENADFMPHNLVVVRPGKRDAIGTRAAAMKPEEIDRRGRAYVPWSDDILGATKLLDAGQRETLKLNAPQQQGDYEYVCTFPGHHQVMWGWLIVTKDVDAYLQANPDVKVLASPAAAHGQH
jgi:glucose/arabinose dehydrogenase/azurin